MTTDQVIVALCNLFLLFVMWQFYKDLLTPVKELNKVRWITGTFWYFGTLVLSELLHSPVVNIIASVVLLSVMTIPYHGTVLKKILIAIMVEALNAACDCVSYYVFSLFSDSGDIYAVSFVGTVILAYIAEIVVRQFFKHDRETKIEWKGVITLLIIPVSELVMMYAIIRSGAGGLCIAVAIICGLVACFSAFYMYDVIVADQISKLHEQTLKKQIDSYKRELDQIEKTERRIEGIRHDLRHHIIEIRSLLNTGNESALSDYIDKLEADMADDRKIVHSGRYEVDSLINYMINEAQSTLKETDIRISLPQDINVELYQLNVILGNLLENAIEAARLSDEQYMGVVIEVHRGILYIEVSNSYSGTIDESKGIYKSTKSYKSSHGLGLQNVERMVREMKGDIEIKHDEKRFYVNVMIYL